MKWDPIELLNEYDCGTDELGNPITVLRPVYRTRARYIPATDAPVQLEGREVTTGTQFFSVAAKASALPEFSHVLHRDIVYKMQSVAAMSPRWTMIKAVEYEVRSTRA